MKITTKQKKTFESDSDQTILNAALKAGLVYEYSCKTGQCGVCKTTLFDGEIVELQKQIALSEEDKISNKILTCCCAAKTDLLIGSEDLSALRGIEVKTLPARISSIKKYADNVIQVKLRLPPNSNFKFLEGQYLDVIHNNIRRSYSISSTSGEKEIGLLIKYFENGRMSDFWFNSAKENDLLRLEGPKGTFFLRGTNNPILFLATGTGIAPVKSILKKLDESEQFIQKQPIAVYWGNRSLEEFVWQPKFKKIKVKFLKVCSRPTSDWTGEIGYVQNVAINDQKDILNLQVYACGSIEMIISAKKMFLEAGLKENKFYSDAFVKSF